MTHITVKVDGTTTILEPPAGVRIGDMIEAVVVATDGVDLVARPGAPISEDR